MIKVINVISDTNIGGAGKMLISFMKLTSKTEFEHLVVVPQNSLLAPELKGLGIKYIEMEGIGEKSLGMSSISKFFKLLKKYKPDIVHTHASMSARIAARLFGKCSIVHTRHSVFDQSRSKKSFPLKQINGFINNSLSDIIIAVSPAAKDNIVETGINPEKVRVVFNGVDKVDMITKEEKSKILEDYGLSQSDFICAIIARLEEVKGHDYVLEAAKILKEYKDIKIIIAGTGHIENELKKKADDLGLGNCIFTGFIKEIYKIENIMKLQLNASYGTEATSLSLLEGMSLGVPAVVSDFGGNPYVIINGKNGIVVPRRKPKPLAAAIWELYNNHTLYNEMSVNATNIYNEKFTSEAMVGNIETIYRNLARVGG